MFILDRSRSATRFRNLIESLFGRTKELWALLRHQIPLGIIPVFEKVLRILRAIENAYYAPLRQDSEMDASDIDVFTTHRSDASNQVQELLKQPGFTAKYKTIKEDALLSRHVPGDLTLDSIRAWNGGPYALRLAQHYINQCGGKLKFAFARHHDQVVVRAKGFRSRFKRTATRTVYFIFSGMTNATLAYCTCKSGARTIGSCSHSVSALVYLAHLRANTAWNPDTDHPRAEKKLEGILDISDFSLQRSREKKAQKERESALAAELARADLPEGEGDKSDEE